MPQPPKSTLFPYTTLFRSDFIEARYAFSFVFANFGIAMAARMPIITTTIRRSEEHTSELQTHRDSVCRLRQLKTNIPSRIGARIMPRIDGAQVRRYRPVVY